MDKIVFTSEEYVKIGDEIWMFAREVNLLYSINIETGKKTIHGCIPEENIRGKRLCSKLIYKDGNIYCLPMNAKQLWIFNIDSKSWKKKIIIGEEDVSIQCKFIQGLIINDRILMIGCMYPGIIIYNTLTSEIQYIRDKFEHLYNKAKEGQSILFRSSMACKDKKIYLASCVTNEIFIIDLVSLDIQIKSVGGTDWSFSGIYYDGDKYWLSPRKGTPIVVWDGENIITQIELPEEYDSNTNSFLGVSKDGSDIVFSGLQGIKNLYIEKDKHLIYQEEERKYLFRDETVSIDRSGMISIKKNDNEIVKYRLDFSKEFYKESMHEMCDKIIFNFEEIVKEDELWGIEDFIRMI